MRRKKNQGLEDMVEKEYEKYVVVPDVHIPYEDKQTVKSILNFIKDQKPDHVVLLGDVVDMYSVSRFDKDPRRASNLQYEFDRTNEFLTDLRDVAGKAKITYIEGNHEARMEIYLKRHPELHGLRDLSVPVQLGLDELDIDYRKELLIKNTFLFTHGRRLSMYAPRWEIDDYGVSGMSGHTHRANSHMKTDKTGVKVWHSVGHICDLKQADYITNPNWQQAVGVVHFEKKGKRFFAETVPIVKHKFIYGGRLYTPHGVRGA